jgi:polyisoprenyl-phosphate glycosyltransferase
MTTRKPVISVIVPSYGCVGTLRALHERVSVVLDALVRDFEIIFVDDHGPQDQQPILEALASEDDRVRVVRMSRNFGQQIAIAAGLAECKGEYAVVIDCDLQDPPESIPDLWRQALLGYDIVYASRLGGDKASRKLGNRIYFWMMDKVAGYKVDPGQGSFSLISRQVIDAYLLFKEPERHYLFILRWLGFRSVTVHYKRSERMIGKSSYTFGDLLEHAIQGFFFQSTVPLQMTLWIGLITAIVSLLLGCYFVMIALLGTPPEGFTTLIVVQLLIGGVILTCLGAVGLYIARIFDYVRERPLYIVDRSTDLQPTNSIAHTDDDARSTNRPVKAG